MVLNATFNNNGDYCVVGGHLKIPICTGSCKSNYHTIMTMMAPSHKSRRYGKLFMSNNKTKINTSIITNYNKSLTPFKAILLIKVKSMVNLTCA
jgi:hypothetical protein